MCNVIMICTIKMSSNKSIWPEMLTVSLPTNVARSSEYFQIICFILDCQHLQFYVILLIKLLFFPIVSNPMLSELIAYQQYIERLLKYLIKYFQSC